MENNEAIIKLIETLGALAASGTIGVYLTGVAIAAINRWVTRGVSLNKGQMRDVATLINGVMGIMLYILAINFGMLHSPTSGEGLSELATFGLAALGANQYALRVYRSDGFTKAAGIPKYFKSGN